MAKHRKYKKTIPIFFAVDDNYAPYLACAIRSLIQNSKAKNFYHINILVESISEENRRILYALQRENVHIDFVNVSDKLREICSRLHLRDYYTKATYYRFFIPELFPQYTKGLYLDCDIIITRDVAKMYKCNLGENILGAVPDEIITDIEVFAEYSEAVLNIPRYEYFNAGVLVMNLEKMRSIHIEEQFARLLGERTYSVAQDQDYLNVLCNGKVAYLNPLWNKTPMPYSNKKKIPYIAHYKINYKPWKYDDVVYGELFWEYAEQTVFYRELIQLRDNYTDAEMQRDREQYDSLVLLAISEVDKERGSTRKGLYIDNENLFGEHFDYSYDYRVACDENNMTVAEG